MTPPSDTAQPAQAACEMRRKAETAIENAAFVTSDKYEDLARAILTYLGTYTAHPEDAGKLIEMGERIAELETCNAELERDLQHPEDAPGGPWSAEKEVGLYPGDNWAVWLHGVITHTTEFRGTEVQCVAVRDTLNRLKGDENGP